MSTALIDKAPARALPPPPERVRRAGDGVGDALIDAHEILPVRRAEEVRRTRRHPRQRRALYLDAEADGEHADARLDARLLRHVDLGEGGVQVRRIQIEESHVAPGPSQGYT